MFESLARHVSALPERALGDDFSNVTGEQLFALEAITGARLSDAHRWWLETYGAGFRIPTAVFGDEELAGFFMGVDAMRTAHDDIAGTLDPRYLPMTDDLSGNYLVVGADGVYRYLHDRSAPDNLVQVAPSFEAWLLSLRAGE